MEIFRSILQGFWQERRGPGHTSGYGRLRGEQVKNAVLGLGLGLGLTQTLTLNYMYVFFFGL